jgi:zinc transport system permease protein
MEPFLLRALAAGVGLAVVSAPLGCFLVWQRMAFFGETVAQASLIGVALALALQLDVTATVIACSIAVALLLVALRRQSVVPVDTLLSLLAHSSLAIGVLATALVKGRSIDLMGFLFGDILSVTRDDLIWIAACGIIVLVVLGRLWHPLLSLAVNEELAAAEGVSREAVRALFVVLLAVVIAMAMKIVGVLLTVAFLIIPAAAARPLATTPEGMAVLAAGIGALGVVGGLTLSMAADTPGGPSIVTVLALLAAAILASSARRR